MTTDPYTLTDQISTSQDIDPAETTEWVQALEAVSARMGAERARYLMLRLVERSRELGVGLPGILSTDYVNTIPPSLEPAYPGNQELERIIRFHLRWNAAVMVTKGQAPNIGVGGHIATYQSSCHLYEVGFNHFFRGKDYPGGGDQVYFQGHGSPGQYSRAYLEGRLSEQDLDHFRQVTKGGLAAYPHPRLMPDFWEFPTVSMGLGSMSSVYQARFNKYLQNRGIKDTSMQRVWAMIGDGEMDEPEAAGSIALAGREGLDNLTWIVNCNLQRLDGPVRANGKVVQEFEAMFKGAGWNVIKVLWGSKWDSLLSIDKTGALLNQLNRTPDAQFQTYTARDAAYIKEHFFNSPELQRLLKESSLTDADFPLFDRAGHDVRKIYAAYNAAVNHSGQPTVILAQTIKGWTLGEDFMARNSNHQMKKLSSQQLKDFRDYLKLDIPDSALEDPYNAPYLNLDKFPEAKEYMLERRRELGGFLPERRHNHPKTITIPEAKRYEPSLKGSGDLEVATTMGIVRLMRDLMKAKDFGERIVPITPDEARTFGMDSMFKSHGIYSPLGMHYDPVDSDMLMSYKTSTKGQILNEGITEAGCMASFQAAGSAYATHGVEMLPMYFFYSMFGLQRTADSIWQAADQRCRGFLMGATAGRTTLTGEGLQHNDGNSILYAVPNPALITYDPAFVYEAAIIIKNGIERMYGDKPEDVIYYITSYNEPFAQPAMPEHVSEQDIIEGIYCYQESPSKSELTAQILTSGSTMSNALLAQDILDKEYGIAADVWSVPGWVGLHRDAISVMEWNREHPTETPRVPLITRRLADNSGGPFVAVTDYVSGVPALVAPYMPDGYYLAILGTDGFGRADTRKAVRRAFRIDAESMVVAVLHELSQEGKIDATVVADALARYGMNYDDIPENDSPA